MSGQNALSRDSERRAHQAEVLLADQRRRDRFQAARERVRPFAEGHVDVAAMATIMLEFAHPGRPVTPGLVKERVNQMYPWIFNNDQRENDVSSR